MKKYLFVVTALTIVFSAGVFASHARAADLSGWAWSDNTGYLSFNSANLNSDDGNYRVSVATSSSNPNLASFSGYAWSSNVGWISFNAADVRKDGGCPASESSYDDGSSGAAVPVGGNKCDPRVDLVSGKVSGWARVLSIANNDPTSGWLHLSGQNHPSGTGGVFYNTVSHAFSGYAYEPSSIGYISFDATSPLGVSCTNNCGGPSGGSLSATCSADTSTALAVPGFVTFSAHPSNANGTVTYFWGGNNSPGQLLSTSTWYSVSGSGPSYRVNDSVTSVTPNDCPPVTVGGAGSNPSITLHVSHVSNDPWDTLKPHFFVAVGYLDSAYLSWKGNNMSPLDYGSCVGEITPSPVTSMSTAPNDWTNANKTQDNQVANVLIKFTQIGDHKPPYTLDLVCTKSATAPAGFPTTLRSSNVTIQVTTSQIEEH